jgi:predicted DNA-binding transcriptional regulator AlpA
MKTDLRPEPLPRLSGTSTDGGDEKAEAAANSVGRLAYRLDDIAQVLGISRRAIERERSAGRFPKPDRVIGRMPLWRVETIRAWLGGHGR